MNFKRINKVPADVNQVVPKPNGLYARTWETQSRTLYRSDDVITDAVLDAFRKTYDTFPVVKSVISQYDEHTIVFDAVYDNCN